MGKYKNKADRYEQFVIDHENKVSDVARGMTKIMKKVDGIINEASV